MKIIAWNCNMAFRKKAHLILAHKPDIVVIPECEHPDKLIFSPDTPKPNDILWFGKNQHKGLGIFSYCDYRFELHKCYNPDFQMIIPIKVTGGEFTFNLFAIWANNPTDKENQYVQQVWKAINHYEKLLKKGKNILIGDFNGNKIWDKPKKENNHSSVVTFLEKKGIFSTYHLHHKQQQGTEEHPTFYLYRHQNKPYHLDYCFASKDFINILQSVEIGDFDFWTKHSDHVPVMVTFD